MGKVSVHKAWQSVCTKLLPFIDNEKKKSSKSTEKKIYTLSNQHPQYDYIIYTQ